MAFLRRNVKQTDDGLQITGAVNAHNKLADEIDSAHNWIAEHVRAFEDGKAARAKRIREAGENAAKALEDVKLRVN